jgi:glycosyltransferase involved in cell wall biosynthesis
VLALVTDGFGGRGGIALYVRDLLTSLASDPRCREVIALPRLMPDAPGELPPKVTYLANGLGGKLRYLFAFVRAVKDNPGIDVVLCGHINLSLLAAAAKWWYCARVLLCIYGTDAWQAPRNTATRYAVACMDEYLSISEITRDRFRAWAQPVVEGQIVPNAIHTDWYRPGPKNPALLARHDVQHRRILITVGRIVASERYKGFDEIIELMPELIREITNLTYLIVGDGDDRQRLERKAGSLGLKGRVVFAGHVAESEKSDYYRLADAFAMPSRGDGFGFVLLEALACGIPVLGSKLDGTREALRDGELGILVDPGNREELRRGILAALSAPRGKVPEGLAYFAYPEFEKRCHRLLDGLLN